MQMRLWQIKAHFTIYMKRAFATAIRISVKAYNNKVLNVQHSQFCKSCIFGMVLEQHFRSFLEFFYLLVRSKSTYLMLMVCKNGNFWIKIWWLYFFVCLSHEIESSLTFKSTCLRHALFKSKSWSNLIIWPIKQTYYIVIHTLKP